MCGRPGHPRRTSFGRAAASWPRASRMLSFIVFFISVRPICSSFSLVHLCLSICLLVSICLSTYLFVCYVCMSVPLYICLFCAVSLSIYLFIVAYLPVHPPVCLHNSHIFFLLTCSWLRLFMPFQLFILFSSFNLPPPSSLSLYLCLYLSLFLPLLPVSPFPSLDLLNAFLLLCLSLSFKLLVYAK